MTKWPKLAKGSDFQTSESRSESESVNVIVTFSVVAGTGNSAQQSDRPGTQALGLAVRQGSNTHAAMPAATVTFTVTALPLPRPPCQCACAAWGWHSDCQTWIQWPWQHFKGSSSKWLAPAWSTTLLQHVFKLLDNSQTSIPIVSLSLSLTSLFCAGSSQARSYYSQPSLASPPP